MSYSLYTSVYRGRKDLFSKWAIFSAVLGIAKRTGSG